MFSDDELKKLLWPLVIEQIMLMLVGMADTAMISHAGEAAISGVALVDMFIYLIITLLTAASAGGAVIVSQYLGAAERRKAELAAGQLLLLALLAGTALTLLCLVGYKGVINLFFPGIEPEVWEAAAKYLLITAVSFPCLAVYDAAAALFRSMEKTAVTMYVSLLMNVINVTGNAIGVLVLNAGVAGVAVPTVLSRLTAGLLLGALAFRRNNMVRLAWANIFTFRGEYMQRIVRIALPNGIENGLFALGKLLVTGIIAWFGTTQIAANGVANSLDMIAIVVVNAVNLAMVTVVGQCVGASEYEQAGYYTKRLMKISYVWTAALSLLVCLLLPWLLHFYELSAETYRLSLWLIILHNALAVLLHPTSFNLANSLRAAGDVKYTMYAGVVSMLVFRLGSAYVLGIGLNLGIIGVWLAMGLDWLARSVAYLLRYRSNRWRSCKAI